MGSGASVQNDIPKEWMDIFKAMKLKPREVQKLFDVYNTVDADRSGSIDVTEMLMFMDIERSLFTQRIFEAFDKDHTHRIDFYEFVVSVWKFCALGKEATCVFAFDLYDSNADGKLTSAEVVTMFRELMGTKGMEQDAIARVLNKLLKEAAANDDFVTVDYFRVFTNQHQALLLPVFGIQNMLRISTLGVSFWDKMSKRRIELRPGVMVPLSELMVLHAHRKLFGAIMEDKHSMGRVSSMMRIVLDNTNNAVTSTAPPPEPKPVLKNTRILNPFAGLIRKTAAPVAPVMVHGNYVAPTNSTHTVNIYSAQPSSPSSSYRVGGLGHPTPYPATFVPPTTTNHATHTASSPRSVVGSGSSSPTSSVTGKHYATHNTLGVGSGSSVGSGDHHSHSHTPFAPNTHSTHSVHSTHGTHSAHNSERSTHLHSSHSHSSSGSDHHHHHSTSSHNKDKEHSSHHHHHTNNTSTSTNKEHSPHGGHSHRDSTHSTRSTHSHSTHSNNNSTHNTNSTSNSSPVKHLTPAQLLQSHPHAKKAALDRPL